MGNPIYNVPGLGGFLASEDRRRAMQQEDRQGQMEQIKLADLFNANQKEQQRQKKLNEILQLSGGDPAKASQLALQAGMVDESAKIHGMIPKVGSPERIPDFAQLISIRDAYAAKGDTRNATLLDAQIKKLNEGIPKVTAPEAKPRLKLGERFIPGTDNVEAIPGSDLYKTQSGKHSKDYQTKLTAATKFDQATKKIDEILSDENKGAFNSNFGGYNAYATQLLPGATQDVGNRIESLKSDMKVAGLEMIRTGGSIGQMTEREWPIVQNMIDTINPRMGEEAARKAFENIKSYMQRIKENADEIYQTEWGGSQFAKTPDTSTSDPLTVNGFKFPSPQAAAAYKKAAGIP